MLYFGRAADHNLLHESRCGMVAYGLIYTMVTSTDKKKYN